MDDIYEPETIDVQLDEYFKIKPISRCRDEFLNTLCEENDDEIRLPGNDEVQNEDDNGEENDEEEEEENEEGSDEVSAEETIRDYRFPYATHNPQVKWNVVKPFIGERYESRHQLKLCLTNYSISKGYQIRFKKCDSVRLVAVCASPTGKNNCPFLCRASWMSTEDSFQVKVLNLRHKCVRNYNNSALMNPTWLAKQFMKELIRKPNLKCKEMQTVVQSKFHCKVSWSKCYRARYRALSLIEGKLSDHYARVWEYRKELLRSNPGSTITVSVVVNPEKTTTFHRIYICFNAIKEGWKRGCHRAIGLDDCFLKGQCKGELLIAIGRDANNQIYPIAWAVVEFENKLNWKWFLQLVDRDLQLHGGSGLCVISDQYKVNYFDYSTFSLLNNTKF